jgi:hypothetical protein
VNVLQVGAMISIASVALAGRTAAGLWLALASVVLTRIFWSGIVTLRTNIWRANYPREVRARVVGRLAIASQATLAVVGFLVGSAIDSSKDSYQGFTPLLAGIGLMGALVYGRIRMRGERAVLEAERASPVAGEVMRPWMGLVSTYRVLRADRRFAQFNLFMFILGLGNLMLMPVLAIALSKRFALGANPGKMCVLITSTLPGVLNPIAVPVWARLLDRSHVVRFRAIHAWFFVLATLLFAIGAQTLSVGVMIVAACVLGIAMGGGALAWNLGHTDFAPPARTAHYMATHVTLNGLRGLMAPFIAVFLYNAMTDGHGESRWASIEPAAVVLSISLALNIAGALGFVWLRGSMGASAGLGRREG